MLPLGVIVAALFCFLMWRFSVEFVEWKNIVAVYAFAAAAGVLFSLMASFAVAGSGVSKKSAIVFGVSFIVFQIILWVLLSVVNVDGLYNMRAVATALAVLFALFAVLCLVAFLRNKAGIPALSRVTAVVLFLLTALSGAYISLENFEIDYRNFILFSSNVSFDSASAAELKVSEAEKERCKNWFDENIINAGSNGKAPAYNFAVGGVSLRDSLADWEFTAGEAEELYRGGKTTEITLKNKNSQMLATVEATIYEENATCEWTVYIKNTGDENSETVSSFYAADFELDIESAELYCNKGSYNASDDFTPLKARAGWIKRTFAGYKGKSTTDYLPYFNLVGDNYSAVLAVGWSGQWQAEISRKSSSLSVTAKQENFEAYLLPDEEVRSPLVSLSFYESENPVKGYNIFRNWVKDCVQPENLPDTITNYDILYVSTTRTAADMLGDINSADPKVYEQSDNFWMDAGWWDGVDDSWGTARGNWTTNSERFPGGIKEISDKAQSVGNGLVLWYETENVSENTALYNEAMKHEGWIVAAPEEEEGVFLWNFAQKDAADYITEYIGKSLAENGVSIYRHDFNFFPLLYWQNADKEIYGGRTGIAENHYVTNLYAYFDKLTEMIPDLLVDNCASGGMRLDLEMVRRSVPLWRSDYNCNEHDDIIEATQAQTFGLSMWLPFHGTSFYGESEYAARSSIYSDYQVGLPQQVSELITKYNPQRENIQKNYYPLVWGGTKNLLAMQFGDEASGSVLVYSREGEEAREEAISFSGLDEAVLYEVYDYDAPENVFSMTGKELMAEGFKLSLAEGKTAKIIEYCALS